MLAACDPCRQRRRPTRSTRCAGAGGAAGAGRVGRLGRRGARAAACEKPPSWRSPTWRAWRSTCGSTTPAATRRSAAAVARQAVDEGAQDHPRSGLRRGGQCRRRRGGRGRASMCCRFSNNTDIAGGNVFVLGPTFQNTANRLIRLCRARRQAADHDRRMTSTTAGELGRRAIAPAACAQRRRDRRHCQPIRSRSRA